MEGESWYVETISPPVNRTGRAREHEPAGGVGAVGWWRRGEVENALMVVTVLGRE